MKSVFSILLCLIFSNSWAFNWSDLWTTQDHQAKTLLDSGQFSKAQETFKNPAWQATAAYRAGHYKDAAAQYQTLEKNTDAFYNQGNALAQDGQLEPAIKAYNHALSLDPTNQDAKHNRSIVEQLLKKQQEKKKQDQDKQDQDKQDQDKQDQDKQDQDKQDQGKQDQDKQNQDKQNQDKQDQDKQDQDKQDQDKQDQNKQDQDKQDKNKKPLNQTPESQADRERKQANEQWLRLIPDDPGGLMREKFLRDYLRRHRQN